MEDSLIVQVSKIMIFSTSDIAINESKFNLGLPLASLGVEFPADDISSVNILPVVELTSSAVVCTVHVHLS